MKLKLPLLLIFILLTACKSKSKENPTAVADKAVETIPIDVSAITPKAFGDVVQSISMLKLKDPDENPIGAVDKVVYYRKNIFVMDAYKANSLYVFNDAGEFQNTIGSLGNGQGEYTYLTNFAFNEYTKEIIILDSGKNNLLFYTIGGEFIRSHKLPFDARSVAVLEENKLALQRDCFSENGMKDIMIILNAETGDIESEFLSQADYLANFSIIYANQLHRNNGELYFMPSMSTSIYQIKATGYEQLLSFDFGDKWPSDEYLEGIAKQHPVAIFNRIKKDGYVRSFFSIEAGDNIQLSFKLKDESFCAYYSRETKAITFYELNENMFDSYTPVGTVKNQFVLARMGEESTSLISFSFK